MGIWETLYNPGFKPLEFDGFRKEAGLNAFTLSPQKWINTTGAIGIVSRSGRYGGTEQWQVSEPKEYTRRYNEIYLSLAGKVK